MIKRLLPSFAAAAVLLLGACSTNRLAQQGDQVDDAYYTEAQAREYERTHAQAEERTSDSDYVTDEELYGDANGNYDDDYYDRYDYDRDYSARIYRFRNYSPWRSYYDTWYDYRFDPYYSSFNSYNFYRPSFGINIGIGGYYGYNRYNHYYNPWGYYGSQYYGNYWGPYSYYNIYNPYSFGNRYYGNYGGGYYGNVGRPVYTNPNYRTRPNRETENVRTGAYPGTSGGRIGTNPSRPERISRGDGSSSTIDRSSQPSSRPTRGTDGRQGTIDRSSRPATQRTETSRPRTESSRPARPQRQEPQRIENRPAERQQSQPSQPAPQRSNDSGSSSRPSRSGGR